MTLLELFEGISFRCPTRTREDIGDRMVEELLTRPKTGVENALFVVTRTPLHDGEDDVRTAYLAGCRLFLCRRELDIGEHAVQLIVKEPEHLLGVLAARLLGHPSRRMRVFAVTGSVGKSCVALLLARILRDAGCRTGLLCSDGVDVGEGMHPLPPHLPNGAEVQGYLAKMWGNGMDYAVLEFSGYQLQHGAAAGLSPYAVCVSSVAPRVVDGVDLACYHSATERLLSLGAPVCVLPVQATLASNADRVIRVGQGGDYALDDFFTVHTPNDGYVSHFSLCEGEERLPFKHPSPFRFAAENALCAAALARVAGVPYDAIAKSFSGYTVPGRMECFYHCGRLVCVDACFSPEDLARSLQALAPLTQGRLCVLLGSVGGRALERRVPLARTAAFYADRVYLTADDPDFESPFAICREMREAMAEPERAEIIPDRRLAIHAAVRDMRPGDVLLLAGKGNLQLQLVHGERRPFPERELAVAALAEHL